MELNTKSNSISASGASISGQVIYFNFHIQSEKDLCVSLMDDDGNEHTLVLNKDFRVMIYPDGTGYVSISNATRYDITIYKDTYGNV